jgi:FeS assembly ATPase SufC
MIEVREASRGVVEGLISRPDVAQIMPLPNPQVDPVIAAMSPEERARAGVFLAFQYPVEIPGVNNAYFLRAALNAIRKHRGEPEIDAVSFPSLARSKMKLLGMDAEMLNRPVNDGFSGGEKKRNEIFQMAVLEPRLAILDETDSGLDIDALKDVAAGILPLPSSGRTFAVKCRRSTKDSLSTPWMCTARWAPTSRG